MRIQNFCIMFMAGWLLQGCQSSNKDSSLAHTHDGASTHTHNDAKQPPAHNDNRSTTLLRKKYPLPQPCAETVPQRRALFGDLHVHSAFSFDAAANSLETYPEDAHRFAKGGTIPFFPLDANGKATGKIKIDRPLDFVSVTDHAEFLGERALCRSTHSPAYQTKFCSDYRSSERQGMIMLGTIINLEQPQRFKQLCGNNGEVCREWSKGPWTEMINAAEQAQDRSPGCSFTTFIGYEYTGTPGLSNIHRNVIFKDHRVPDVPVSYIEAPRAEKLWQMLDDECSGSGCEYIAIPHNSNLANGRMFSLLQPGDHEHEHSNARHAEHFQQRQQHEPVMEIFQHKGNSECFNRLSSIFGEPDELCEMEAVRTLGEKKQILNLSINEGELGSDSYEALTNECGETTGAGGMVGAGCVAESDFHRSNLLKGLRDLQTYGVNSAKLGVIASTDTHVSTPGAVSETSWQGHVSVEATPEERLQPGLITSGIDGNPGGLAGVWATENSRSAVFDALRRKEVFGTTGPRIEPRLFAGWGLADNLCETPDGLAIADQIGVPMGADLPPSDGHHAPAFYIHATADRFDNGAPLQHMQLIKGWVDDKQQAHYKVFAVAGDPDNGATVNIETGQHIGDGFDQLCAVFTDPEFDRQQHAFYYMRVVENPTARWSTLDCLRIPLAQRPDVCAVDSSTPKTIQEMAWSSPIWYTPATD